MEIMIVIQRRATNVVVISSRSIQTLIVILASNSIKAALFQKTRASTHSKYLVTKVVDLQIMKESYDTWSYVYQTVQLIP